MTNTKPEEFKGHDYEIMFEDSRNKTFGPEPLPLMKLEEAKRKIEELNLSAENGITYYYQKHEGKHYV